MIGARLLARKQTGALQLVRTDREPIQLHQLAAQGFVNDPNGAPVVLAPALLRTLDCLSARATRAKPLALLSLYRPLSPARNREPHGRGQAIDLWAFGGYRFDARRPAECERALVAVLQALGPRPYRLGLPKPPGTDPRAFFPPPSRRTPARWPFFPAPLPELMKLPGPSILGNGPPLRVVAPHKDAHGKFVWDRRRKRFRPAVRRWENERYAPLSDVRSATLRTALAAAARRGVLVHRAFPDALDHLHLDVRTIP